MQQNGGKLNCAVNTAATVLCKTCYRHYHSTHGTVLPLTTQHTAPCYHLPLNTAPTTYIRLQPHVQSIIHRNVSTHLPDSTVSCSDNYIWSHYRQGTVTLPLKSLQCRHGVYQSRPVLFPTHLAIQWGRWSFFPGVKKLGHEADRLPLSSAYS